MNIAAHTNRIFLDSVFSYIIHKIDVVIFLLWIYWPSENRETCVFMWRFKSNDINNAPKQKTIMILHWRRWFIALIPFVCPYHIAMCIQTNIHIREKKQTIITNLQQWYQMKWHKSERKRSLFCRQCVMSVCSYCLQMLAIVRIVSLTTTYACFSFDLSNFSCCWFFYSVCCRSDQSDLFRNKNFRLIWLISRFVIFTILFIFYNSNILSNWKI